MIDFIRVVGLHSDFLSSACIHAEHEPPEWFEPLRSLRIRYWYEMLRQRAGFNTAYMLEKRIEPTSFARNPDGSIKYYKNKWIHYSKGESCPQAALQRKVEAKFPGSTRELHHPLWSVLDLENKRVMRGSAFLHQLSPGVRDVLFMPVQEGIQEYLVRVPVTKTLLVNLERRASMDVLACLVWLLREAAEKQSVDAVRICRTLHNVLTMMALELYGLKIAMPLLQLFIKNILPLGLIPHLRVGMSPVDYIDASGYLHRLVYQVLNGSRLSLGWAEKVKIMQQLIKGKFGFDVCLAMSQKFELDDTVEEIPEKVIRAHDRGCRDHAWGWISVKTGGGGGGGA